MSLDVLSGVALSTGTELQLRTFNLWMSEGQVAGGG